MGQGGNFRIDAPELSTSSVGQLSNFDLFFFMALLFLAPNILFAATALQPAPAALVLAGCAGVVAFLWRSRSFGVDLSAALDWRKLGLCLAIGLVLCLLGGEGHFFYATWDWLVRDAVLSDLVRDGSVPTYNYLGQDYYFRAPLGMYLVPAAAGRVFGLTVAHLTLLTTNSFLFSAILYFASGLDILGYLTAWALSLQPGPMSNQSLEWWTGTLAPDVTMQYSSMVTQIFWVPNHTAPGWFIAILVILQSRDEIALSTLIACCAALVIWSPLPVIGALLIVAVLALQPSLRKNFSAENLLAIGAGLAFLPIALYLLTNVDEIARGPQTSARGFAWIYVYFLLIEISQAIILLCNWRRIPATDRPTLMAAFGTLCLLPVYSFGPGNDLLMRGSIPALFLVAFNFARLAVSTPRDGGVLATAISSIILISAATPVMQMKQAIFVGRYSLSDCNLLTAALTATPFGLPANYLAPVEGMRRWLLAVDRQHAPAQLEYRYCWPDHPLRDLVRHDTPD